MAESEFAVTMSRTINAPADFVWALVSDTNRVDRAVGLAAGSYSFEQSDPDDPESRERVATAKELGLRIRWVEPPYEWIEGRSVRGMRRFIEGPVARGNFEVTLTPKGDKTEVTTKMTAHASNPIGKLAMLVKNPGIKRASEEYLSSIDKTLTALHKQFASRDSNNEPASAWVRRAVVELTADPVQNGPISPVDEANLAHRLKRLDDRTVKKSIRDKLVHLLRDRPDEELAAIRPFELAHAWNIDRRDALRAFLYAARAGLFDLRWQLNCPTCKVGASNAQTLSAVGRTAHCDTCNIDFALDFAAHVEAVFSPAPSVRPVQSAVYCASSPWFRPHVFAQLCIEPGQEREIRAPLPLGDLLFRTLRGQRRVNLNNTVRPGRVQLVIDETTLSAERVGEAGEHEDSLLVIKNNCKKPEYLLIERAGWSADIVFGSVIASMPEFLDLFATEAPASGVELSVSSLTVLFSDLTGSTAMYERLGDARAFALVQEHFNIMTESVAKHGGAVVKTMGDAIMATFASPADAMKCSIEMVERCHVAQAKDGLTVKLGFFEGPCLAVRANDRLDYFGTTVNVAARLQAQAQANEIVLTRELAAHTGVASVIAKHPLVERQFEASLKGIQAIQLLVGFNAQPADP
jgi:class 3 adenylate cyclase